MKHLRNLPFAALLTLGLGSASGAGLPGTPFTTFPANDKYSVSNIADGDLTTYFYANADNYSWAALDLGEACVLTSVKFAPASSGSEMVLGMFQGANNADFSDAIPLAFVTEAPAKGRLTELPVTCSRGVRYVRYVGTSGKHSAIAEMEVYGTPGAGDDSALWQLTNLPTVVVNTVNSEEPYDKEHDIPGSIIIISKDGSDILDAPGTIRERGNGSRQFPKKPWRLKFDKKQNMLDAPAKAKKWTLINNYGDKTLMRNILAFDIARQLGMEYVPYCQPVDVVLNGEYKGCYQLCDQIEVNKGRVDIDEMEPTDIEGDNLTGGYLVEVDAYANEEVSWFRTNHYGLPVTIKSPDEDEITPEQTQYITDYFNLVEKEIKSYDGYDATDPVTGYRRLFDIKSFIQHMLVNEVAGNTDTYWSTYMTKRRNDPKVYTGPVWDFDLGFNNDIRTYPVPTRSGNGYLWNAGIASAADGMVYFAQRILIKDETTAAEIRDIWSEARDNGFSAESMNKKVDELAEELDASQKLNFMRWPILNQMVHQNPRAGGSYATEVNWVKEYFTDQFKHLDSVIGYVPGSSDGVDDISADDAPIAVYNLQGIRVAVVSSLKEISSLPSGIYIANGRKFRI